MLVDTDSELHCAALCLHPGIMMLVTLALDTLCIIGVPFKKTLWAVSHILGFKSSAVGMLKSYLSRVLVYNLIEP